MVKVKVEYRDERGQMYSEEVEMSRVPCRDEIVALDPNEPGQYVVQVTHFASVPTNDVQAIIRLKEF